MTSPSNPQPNSQTPPESQPQTTVQLSVSPHPQAPPTEHDAQRQALGELVVLCHESADREAEQIAARQQSIGTATRRLTRALADLDEARKSQQQTIASEADALRDKAITENDRVLADLKTVAGERRSRILGEHEAAEAGVRKQLDQSVWLAESVHETTQHQLVVDHKRAEQAVVELDDTLVTTTRQAQELMLTHRITPPAAVPPSLARTIDAKDIGALDAELSDHRARAEACVAEIRDDGAGRMLSGSRPTIIATLLTVLGAAAGQLYGRFAGEGGELDWRRIGIGAGIGLCAGLISLGILWLMARSRERAAYVRLQHELDAASQLGQAKVKATELRRERESINVTHRYQKELAAAKERFGPPLQKLVAARDQAIEQAKADILARKKSAEEALARRLAEISIDRDRRLAEIQAAHQQGDASATGESERSQQLALKAFESESKSLAEIWDKRLEEIRRGIHDRPDEPRTPVAWDDPAWAVWSCPRAFPSSIRFGELSVDLRQIADRVPQELPVPPAFSLPAALTFPRGGSLVIHADRSSRSEALDVLRMVVARLLTGLPPGRARFTFIDPVGLGQTFAGFMHLADHDDTLVGGRIWTEPEHIEQRLADLTEHMETVIQKYLRNEYATIDDYNRQAGELAEPYRFLVVSDFPVNFSAETVRRLNSIASTGARCGVYTLVFRDDRSPLPGGSHVDELEARSVRLTRDGQDWRWQDKVLERFPLSVDPPPSDQALTRLMEQVGIASKDSRRVEVPFGAIAPGATDLWSRSAAEELTVPIGRSGATRQQQMRLGRGVAQHALIAGKTGSGKSTLLNVIITNIGLWYSPDEVELYLVDFKKGVEFKAYAVQALPHARAIAVESDREFGLSVLQRLDAELVRRGELFRRAAVQDLPAYRRWMTKLTASDATGAMPRILLVIDEYQEFFSEDDRIGQEAGLLLDRLVRQGRAFGVHVLLGSQTIGGTAGLARSTIGQMAVRVALQTSEADSALILGDNNYAARLLGRPGEAIYNDAGGLVEANSPFQISWLPDAERETYLRQVAAQSGGKPSASKARREPPVVFEGNAPADIAQNRLLAAARAANAPAAPVRPLWVGEPVAIKDPTGVPLRRQSGGNVLVVGQQEDTALAMMGSMMASILASEPKPRVFILDGSPSGSTTEGALARLGKALGLDVESVDYRGVPDCIASIAEDLKTRIAADRPDPSDTFIFVYGLQRYRVLRKSEDAMSFGMSDEAEKPQTDRLFSEILRDGPGAGIHAILWVDTAASLDRTLDRSSVRECDHRILLQMSAADSSTLIDSPAANRLGFHRALAYSEEQGVLEKFRPYAMPPIAWAQQRGGA